MASTLTQVLTDLVTSVDAKLALEEEGLEPEEGLGGGIRCCIVASNDHDAVILHLKGGVSVEVSFKVRQE